MSAAPINPLSMEESETLAETASKLERLRLMARKDRVNDGTAQEEETEQALESHEVVELQAFVLRKEWIEEKIQFLESLPVLDIFAGMQELSKTHDEIPTLATRAQLDTWFDEHDKIEKETEVFDAGDLKKLKAVTKAATQRNLSPEDTDLIEITLHTLFTLDRLLHLLRDRSEQLDLFSLRITWEEQRASAYSTRDGILSEVKSFLERRLRWSPAIYNDEGMSASNSSLNLSSDSQSLESRDPFSRSARFNLSEQLSRDIVQLSSRVSSLRNGAVTSSGKALDKLIDDSRKPVPDPMLDEQDRVEEKCDKELASVSKFLMSTLMQWKKADEIYVETRKDLNALEALVADVESASNELPSRRRNTMFSNRIETLKKRLQSRLDQTLPTSLPLPKHSLFPDHDDFNAELVNILSNEMKQSRSSLLKVEQRTSSYRVGCDMVDEAENLRKELTEFREGMASITSRFQTGFDSDDGDGLPPDLTQDSCVEPLRFSTFLAMFPSLLEQASEVEKSTTNAVKRGRLAALRLDKPGISDDYKHSFLKDIETAEEQLRTMTETRNATSVTVNRLRDVRRIWSTMDELTKSLDTVTPELKDALLRHRWKQQIGGETAPPTPESPRTDLPSELPTPESFNNQILELKKRLEQDVIDPLSGISDIIPASLHKYIRARRDSIERFISDVQGMNRLLVDVRGQSSVMETVREEVHALEGRIEDSNLQYDDHYDNTLRAADSDSTMASSISAETEESEITAKEQAFSVVVNSTQSDVTKLVDSLPTRVPFISRHSPIERSSNRTPTSSSTRLPFDPATVDRVVRNDSNAYALRLTGGAKSLQHKRSLSTFYRAARNMSRLVTLVRKDMSSLSTQLEQHTRELEELSDSHLEGDGDGLSTLVALKDCVDDIGKVEGSRLQESISMLRENIAQMEGTHGIQEDSTTRSVLGARVRMLEEVTSHSRRIFDKLEALKTEVEKAEQAELSRLAEKAKREEEAAEAERIENALRQKEREEAERLEEERLENERLEKEKLEKEDSIRLQEEKAAEIAAKGLRSSIEEDVFGTQSPVRQTIDKETTELLSLIRSLRKQLKSIGLNGIVRPSGASHHRSPSSGLPPSEMAGAMALDFELLEQETNKLPGSSQNTTADTELRSLRLEMEASRDLLCRIQQLARLRSSVVLCDASFSEFLDYIDSYPNPPPVEDETEMRPSEYGALLSPEERLSEKMSQVKGIVGDMSEHFGPVADDPRAVSEHNRLKQTWEELMEMAMEKISGRSSRAGSASTYNGSGRSSSASMRSVNTTESKRSRYANLSVGGSSGFLAPTTVTKRRATSASSAGSSKQTQQPRRPSLATSKPGSRSTSASGPPKPTPPPSTAQPGRSLFNSTFASRQRTASISSVSSIPTVKASAPPVTRRRMSSTLAETPRSVSPALSTSTRSTWSRAPRQSFSSLQRASTPERRKPRSKYIANPKNKLDMALGDVINNLPVEINVEAVADTWKDKSGKYWIGGSEPKLCFCRILRSQTVMVRVGGGWSELSKFIKDHFSDLFRMLPETPPRPGSASKERWISAATLRNADADSSTTKSHGSPGSPGSPGSLGRNLPSFAISTPDGTQRTHRTSSPGSSPLTPLQFIRRADANASEISLSSIAVTNEISTSGVSTASSIRPRRRMSSTSSKAAWKP